MTTQHKPTSEPLNGNEILAAFASGVLSLRKVEEILGRVRSGAWTREDARRYGVQWRNAFEEQGRQLELAIKEKAIIAMVRECLGDKIPSKNRVSPT